MTHRFLTATTIAAAVALCCAGAPVQGDTPVAPDPQTEFRAFLAGFEGKLIPLSRDTALAGFESSVSGKEEDYARSAALQLELRKLYADPATFARLKAWRDGAGIEDPLLARQLEILYLGFLGNQLPEATLAELVKRQTAIEQTFNTFRATVDGKPASDNDLNTILRESTDPARLETAWKASKEVGAQVAPAIVELVKLRNQAAKALGFRNFQVMQLALSEQDPAAIEKLFDELDVLTAQEFAAAKQEIDTFLAKRLGIAREALRPWHYQDRFFQTGPAIYPVDLDGIFAGKDLVDLARRYFAGIGLPIDDILARSDLFEKPGKYQHAFSTDIDRAGDVRILCSLKPTAEWMDTLLHEAGHGVYSKFNDPALPWLLRDAAHTFTTEAMANLFGRMASNPAWMQEMVGISAAERAKVAAAVSASQRLEQLTFSRWSQVMFRFEKAMYENPEQDLDSLWWDLVERYQLLTRPAGRKAPDWAAKIHVALYPAYYHNYLLGQLLASQLAHTIGRDVLKVADVYGQSFVGRPEVGAYLQERVFKPGMTLPWNDMIEKATGEKLTAKYYAEQFVRR
ncbi:MAG: M2 family metallopeptidase [Holophagales bacterium]|nr:MAG: M2 family metallopeptidase [Holophagales bacterium]